MHVVLDEKQSKIVGKARHPFEDFPAFLLRNSGRRFVEEQTFWAGCERQRNLQKSLTAVGKFARNLIAGIAQMQLAQNCVSLLDRLAMRAYAAPELSGQAASLQDCECNRFKRI